MFNNIKVVCGFVQISADPTILYERRTLDRMIPADKAGVIAVGGLVISALLTSPCRRLETLQKHAFTTFCPVT